MNKKAGFGLAAMVYYAMVSIFILTLIMFTYLFIINGFKLNIIYQPSGIEENVLVNRVIYSSNCFIYYDVDTFRSYPGVIDINKFNQENFDTCLDTNKIVRLTLKDHEENIIKELRKEDNVDETLGGEKFVFIYDNGLKPAVLDFRFLEDNDV